MALIRKLIRAGVEVQHFAAAVQSRGVVATAKHELGVNRESGKKAPPEIVALRRLSCLGNDIQPLCPKLVREADAFYCGACACGKHKLAAIDPADGAYSKLDYPRLACPLKRPGFTNAQ